MVITYYGVSCLKIQSGDTILAFDPPSKKSSFKAPRFQADIVFVSQDHPDFNGFENISSRGNGGGKEPFLVNSAGEYEIGGIMIRGVDLTHLNNIYSVIFENINICHLGDFNEKDFTADVLESLGNVDVLFAPAKEGVLKTINQIEPKIIIPMYKDKKDLKKFLEDIGQDKVKPQDKFTFKKKDIAEKNSEVIVLDPSLN